MPLWKGALAAGGHIGQTMENLVSANMREWARSSIARIGQRLERPHTQAKRQRRMLVIHLDGVPWPLMVEAVQTGQMPFFSSLVKSGAYSLDTAFWGSPASTPCFQAALLYGLRHPNLPAYSWFDRELGREVRMNAPRDALAIEQRLGRASASSLLEGGGTTYMSLFAADATSWLSMSGLARRGQLLKSLPDHLKGTYAARRRGVCTYLRDMVCDVRDTARDVRAWVQQVKDWRHEREYMLNRFFLVSFGWTLSCARAQIDMVTGVPAIYLVYGNFDEVAHRRGPFSPQARNELHRVDASLEELYAFAKSVAHPYDLYFLSDHGHVDSAPFEQRIGKRLKAYLFGGAPASLSEDVERGLLDGRPPPRGIPSPSEDEPVVVEAGNFAHVYLSRGRALEAREVLELHREVFARAVANPDIGIVAVRRGNSAVAVIGGGVYGPDEVDRAPLPTAFSRRAVADLLRELPFMSTAGDLVLYGQSVSRTGTVGFAWEFGSHGGLTRIETDSVICWPTDVPIDLGSLGHAVELHEKLSEVYRH